MREHLARSLAVLLIALGSLLPPCTQRSAGLATAAAPAPSGGLDLFSHTTKPNSTITLGPPSNYSCTWLIDGDYYDFSSLRGQYVTELRGAHEKFRLSLCERPTRCNGQDDVAVCHHQRARRVYGMDYDIESSAGQYPMDTSLFRKEVLGNRTALIVPFTRGNYASVQKDISRLVSMVEIISGIELQGTSAGPEIERAISDFERLITRMDRATVVRFICDPDYKEKTPMIHALGLLESINGSWTMVAPNSSNVLATAIYGINVTHACLCPNANCTPPTDNSPEVCAEQWETNLFSNTPAIVVIVLLVLFEKRTQLWPKLLFGRPGLPIPINFLQERNQRFVYCLIFGGFSSIALGNLVRVFLSTSYTIWGKGSMLYSMLLMVLLAMLFYPIAIAFNCSNQLVGSILGLTYGGFATYTYMSSVACYFRGSGIVPHGLIMLPTLACLLGCCTYFSVTFVVTVYRIVRAALRAPRSVLGNASIPSARWKTWRDGILRAMERTTDKDALSFYRLRVIELLRSPRKRREHLHGHDDPDGSAASKAQHQQKQRQQLQQQQQPSKYQNYAYYYQHQRQLVGLRRIFASVQISLSNFASGLTPGFRFLRRRVWVPLRNKIYAPISSFRFSPRILCMATVAYLLLFQIVLLWITYVEQFASWVHSVLDGTRCEAAGVMVSVTDLYTGNSNLLLAALRYIPGFSVNLDIGLSCSTTRIVHKAVYYSFLGSGIISGVVQAIFLTHMLLCYRKHIRRLCTGDRSFLPRLKSYNASFAVVDALKYGGFQIAFILVGWLIIATIFCLVCLFIAFAIVLPILKIYDDWFWRPILLPHLWPVLVSVLFYVSQLLLVRFLFSARDSYDIRHMRVFHNFDFFVFFINIFIGLYTFAVRIILNFGFGLLWVSRLDKNMMSRGYELYDPGYRAYVGFLLLEYYYSNPIMITATHYFSKTAAYTTGLKASFMTAHGYSPSMPRRAEDVKKMKLQQQREEQQRHRQQQPSGSREKLRSATTKSYLGRRLPSDSAEPLLLGGEDGPVFDGSFTPINSDPPRSLSPVIKGRVRESLFAESDWRASLFSLSPSPPLDPTSASPLPAEMDSVHSHGPDVQEMVMRSAGNLKDVIPTVALLEREWGREYAKLCRARRARTRWFLAYTLINNPSLRMQRKATARRRVATEDIRKVQSYVWHIEQEVQNKCDNCGKRPAVRNFSTSSNFEYWPQLSRMPTQENVESNSFDPNTSAFDLEEGDSIPMQTFANNKTKRRGRGSPVNANANSRANINTTEMSRGGDIDDVFQPPLLSSTSTLTSTSGRHGFGREASSTTVLPPSRQSSLEESKSGDRAMPLPAVPIPPVSSTFVSNVGGGSSSAIGNIPLVPPLLASSSLSASASIGGGQPAPGFGIRRRSSTTTERVDEDGTVCAEARSESASPERTISRSGGRRYGPGSRAGSLRPLFRVGSFDSTSATSAATTPTISPAPSVIQIDKVGLGGDAPPSPQGAGQALPQTQVSKFASNLKFVPGHRKLPSLDEAQIQKFSTNIPSFRPGHQRLPSFEPGLNLSASDKDK